MSPLDRWAGLSPDQVLVEMKRDAEASTKLARKRDGSGWPREFSAETISQSKITRATNRRKKVLELHECGLTQPEIAARLNVSRNTIKSDLCLARMRGELNNPTTHENTPPAQASS